MKPNPTSTLPPPARPDARVDLPNTSCEPLVGLAEAAVLFAADRADAARACLEQAILRPPFEPRAWAMLFELHRALGDRASFDALLARAARSRPPVEAPPWSYPPHHAQADMVRLSRVPDHDTLVNDLLAYGRARRVIAIDLAEVTRIDYALAPRFCSTLRLLTMQSKRVILANIAQVHLQLLEVVGLPAGVAIIARRAPSAAASVQSEEEALQAA